MHIFVTGQTESGKTEVAKRLARAAASRGQGVIVYDPLAPGTGEGVNGWCGRVYTDWVRFRAVFWASRGCMAVIDEAGEVFAEQRNDAQVMLTRGRHVDPSTGGGGHGVVLIAQRVKMVPPNARNQCAAVFAFQQGRNDARELADEWGDDAFLALPELPKLHYITKRRCEPSRRGVVTF